MNIKIITAILLSSTAFLACKSKKSATLEMSNIRFVLTETSDYCGGAAPPEELLKVLETPRPLRTRTVIFETKNDGVIYNPVIEFTSPDTVLSLPIGEYKVYPDPGEHPDWPKQYEACMQEYYSTPIATFEILKGETQKAFNIHFTCNPCGEPAP